jgi:transposase-like protein
MLANPDMGVTEIAHHLGVSPATLYRHISAARTENTPSVPDLQLNQADRLGVYVRAKICGDFAPGLQL